MSNKGKNVLLPISPKLWAYLIKTKQWLSFKHELIEENYFSR